MVNKYCSNPNCDWEYEASQHDSIPVEGIVSACKVAIGISAFAILGLIGSADVGRISIAQFFVYELIAVASLLTSIRVINTIK